MRVWPRSARNDPYYAGSQDLAQHLRQSTGLPVLVGFNEFCAPSLDEALDQAAAAQPGRIVVVTPMMTRGGEHVEREIPASVGRAQSRHPGVRVEYLWPFDVSQVADFLAARIAAW
jgi:sirohydrochlorin cobaltochelatase